MVKVNLPKVEEETRSELNQIKARRNDKTLGETLDYLVELDKNKLDLTYEELEALVSISRAVDDSTDQVFMRNCKSGSLKLYSLMKMMEEKNGD